MTAPVQPLTLMNPEMNQERGISPQSPNLCIPVNTMPIAPVHNRANDIDRSINIQRQQERILLLRHAVKCKKLPGECQHPLCHKTKILTRHMTVCRDGRRCAFSHCASSKILLAHYSRCTKRNKARNGRLSCAICQPIKEIICREKADSKTHFRSMDSLMSEMSQVSLTTTIEESSSPDDEKRSPNEQRK